LPYLDTNRNQNNNYQHENKQNHVKEVKIVVESVVVIVILTPVDVTFLGAILMHVHQELAIVNATNKV